MSTPGFNVTSFHFYPRPPRGGRLRCFDTFCGYSHFYPRPPRGGRPCLPVALRLRKMISIHALREEGDGVTLLNAITTASISIHALREEGDVELIQRDVDGKIFLSTPSARRATVRPSHERVPTEISIHALREEGDDTI